MSTRTFTIIGSGLKDKDGGRYVSKDGETATAAKKAGAQLYRSLTAAQISTREKNGHGKIKFILKETTRGSRKKTYSYAVKRITLKTPKTVQIRTSSGTSTIVYKYQYKIEKCPE